MGEECEWEIYYESGLLTLGLTQGLHCSIVSIYQERSVALDIEKKGFILDTIAFFKSSFD